jgi:hypothetical protein
MIWRVRRTAKSRMIVCVSLFSIFVNSFCIKKGPHGAAHEVQKNSVDYHAKTAVSQDEFTVVVRFPSTSRRKNE